MKSGVRAVGVAESYRKDAASSTVAGCVVRADRVVDGVAFSRCTVGGTDITSTVRQLWGRLAREDVQYVIVAGVALAWYNILDMSTLHEAIERPILAVSFESSDGLESAIRDAVDDPDDRVRTYNALPPREPVTVNDEQLFLRAIGCPRDKARDVITAFTPEGGRPEPVRVARLAARAGDELWQHGSEHGPS